MMANRAGLFHAYLVEIGMDETGPNKLATCGIRFALFEELVQGDWIDIHDEGLEITGYFYLEKRDGALNTVAIESLKAALGWDGRDPFWLQETDLAQQPVQVKLGYEEYQGQQRLKVLFLNPYGASPAGGVRRGDDGARKSIGHRLGPKLRAAAGGTPANAPKPAGRPANAPEPAGRPAPPKAAAATAGKPVPAPRQGSEPATMEQAWGAFVEQCPAPPEGKWDQAAIEKEWFRILAELFPGKQPEQLTPAEWGVMLAEGPGRIVPF
jgi:hypothetical protein